MSRYILCSCVCRVILTGGINLDSPQHDSAHILSRAPKNIMRRTESYDNSVERLKEVLEILNNFILWIDESSLFARFVEVTRFVWNSKL